MHVTKIFEKIDSASGANEKLEILKEHADNEDLQRVFQLANDPFIRFHVKSERIAPKEIDLESFYDAVEYEFSTALDMLGRVINREVTGNAAISYLSDILSGLSGDESELMKRVIDKNLRCGIKAKQANKIWPGLIGEMPLLKCLDASKDQSAVDGMVFKAMAQLKIDAARCVAVRYEDRVELLSSSGKLFTKLTSLSNELFDMMNVGDQIDGELWFMNLPRKKSNGIANKSIKGTIKPHEATDVKFIVWDRLIDFEMFNKNRVDRPYIKRFNSLMEMIPDESLHLSLVEYKIVESFQETNEYLDSVYARGEEGIILKHMDGPWEFKRSKYAIKYKRVQEAEFEIYKINEGTGKNKDRMGDVEVKTSDGIITCGVGGGYTDKDRDWFWEHREELVRDRRIMTVRYSERIDNSLFLSRFVELRFDKDEADPSDRI